MNRHHLETIYLYCCLVYGLPKKCCHQKYLITFKKRGLVVMMCILKEMNSLEMNVVIGISYKLTLFAFKEQIVVFLLNVWVFKQCVLSHN